MAGNSFNFSRLVDMLGAAKSSDEKRLSSLGILIAVDPSADRDLIARIRSCFVSERLDTLVAVRPIDKARAEIRGVRDAAVFVVGERGALAATLAIERARRGTPCAIVAQSSLDLPKLGTLDTDIFESITCIFSSNPDALERKLARWLLDATDKQIACAASFAFCRTALATRMKVRTAAENALLGFTGMAGSSDFTVMTFSQLTLAFDMAAMYGDELSMGVLADVALVLLSAYGSRNAERMGELILPFGTRLTRAFWAFAGTMLAGSLVEARHDGSMEAFARTLGRKAVAHITGERRQEAAIVPVRASLAASTQ
jgi:hypothetical protein